MYSRRGLVRFAAATALFPSHALGRSPRPLRANALGVLWTPPKSKNRHRQSRQLDHGTVQP